MGLIIKIKNRVLCCSNRITNWNILLYDKENNLINSYVNLNGFRYDLNNILGSEGQNDHLGEEFSFILLVAPQLYLD